ncbi:MAG TPA: GGDEF domain-containing protein, partial [Armatimonadota bacterium]
GFHRSLITRFGEVEGLVRIPDLPTLRKSLTFQVSGLRTAVQDKDRQDSDQMASLQQEILRLEGRLVEATVEAQTDPATGAHNRRALDAYLKELVAEAELGSQSFCVAMVDMDGLKAINDTHGHQIGDRAILALVQCLRAGIRQSDFLARYGGDEFALVLVGIGREPARAQAERLLRTLHQGSYSFQREGQDHKIGLRASLGLSFYRAGDTPETLLGRADRAVYQAKQAGKGRVCLEE